MDDFAKTTQDEDLYLFEKEKFELLWSSPINKIYCSGLRCIKRFMIEETFYQFGKGQTFADLGCGSGRAGEFIHRQGLNVDMLDIATNCLDDKVTQQLGETLKFWSGTLWNIPEDFGVHDYVLVAEVLEHLPYDKLIAALTEISAITRYGAIIKIHCDREPISVWLAKLLNLFSFAGYYLVENKRCVFVTGRGFKCKG